MPSFPANVFPVVTGGLNGVIRTGCIGASNGATPGAAGNFFSGFVLPALNDTSPVCKAVLPTRIINSFKENTDQNKRFFTGVINDPMQVGYCILQRSDNGINFTNIQTFTNNGKVAYIFNDDPQSVTKYYRMLVVTKDGSKKYSDIIFIKGISERIINVNIYPNPVSNILNLQINSAEVQSTQIKITDMAGRIYFTSFIQLHSGQQTYKIDLSNFAAGTYSIQLLSEKIVLNKMFSKL